MTTHLMAGFITAVMAKEPTSVLDVGCGDAELLLECREQAVPAVGLELDMDKLRAARDRDLDVRAVNADRLGCPDRCFDVVTSRHVLHHLVDPGSAVSEFVRAASRLVVLAEADFPVALPGQALAREIDEWSKAVHRSLGLNHFNALGYAGITALLEAHGLRADEASFFHDPRPVNGVALVARTLADCRDDELRLEGEQLAERSRHELVTRPSSCVVVAQIH